MIITRGSGDNAYKYGFVIRYPDGKESVTGVSDYNYAFRYVGYAHAYYMHENGLCLEEYISLLQKKYSDSRGTRRASAHHDG